MNASTCARSSSKIGATPRPLLRANYYVTTTVFWPLPSGYLEGGKLYAEVAVTNGETANVILTR
jgi:hypothetical protein